MSDIRAYIRDALAAYSKGAYNRVHASKRGELYVLDWFTTQALEGRAFQVRAGTITAPLTGDVAITDTFAEMCADVAIGTTIIPVYLNGHVESLNGGTLPEIAAKSVATVSSAGAAFTPLPLDSGGPAAASTARVAGAGGVTVTAELATTTLRHFANLVAVAGDVILADHLFRMPPKLRGPRCFYVQIAGAVAGPLYFAHFDYIEIPTASID